VVGSGRENGNGACARCGGLIPPGEPWDFRYREALATAEPIQQELASWPQEAVADLEFARPEIPDALDDRAEEAWEPLFAIALLAGGDLPERTWMAALELSGDKTAGDEALGVWLLRDIRGVFEERGVDRLSSASLAAGLNEIETSPWGDIRGKELDPRSLARRLKRFEIRPRTVRFHDETTAKGYLLEPFEDAFSRYLDDSERHTVTTRMDKRFAADSQPSHVTDEESGKPASANGCVGVSDKSPSVAETPSQDVLDGRPEGWLENGQFRFEPPPVPAGLRTDVTCEAFILVCGDVPELLEARRAKVVGCHLSGMLTVVRPHLAASKREEHLHSRSVTCGRERTAISQSRDEREPEAAFIFRVRPKILRPSATVCNGDYQFVADHLRTHIDGTGLALWICVPHRVGYGFADAKLDGLDLHARHTGLAGKARDSLAERADALRCRIGTYLKRGRHRTCCAFFPVLASSKPSRSGIA
jgi:Protein of unknown function (DUF3631)